MTIKKICFLRTAPYDYLIEGMDLYDSFNALAKGNIAIKLKSNAKETFLSNVPKLAFEAESVYTSSTNSLMRTAKFIANAPQPLKILDEIGYVMEDFISRFEFYDKNHKPQVNLAREKFVKAFINNQLQEDRDKVYKRINRLLQLLKDDSSRVIVVITHGFMLKIIESYIRNPNIRLNSKILRKYFNGKTEGFKFCEGFYVDFNNNKFVFNSYIKNELPRRQASGVSAETESSSHGLRLGASLRLRGRSDSRSSEVFARKNKI